MKSLFELTEGRYEKPERRGPNSERAEVVEALCAFMRDGKAKMKYWLGRTRKLAPAEIYELMRRAKDGNNPPALFNHLLRKRFAQDKVAEQAV